MLKKYKRLGNLIRKMPEELKQVDEPRPSVFLKMKEERSQIKGGASKKSE
jgi:hypothetical protein